MERRKNPGLLSSSQAKTCSHQRTVQRRKGSMGLEGLCCLRAGIVPITSRDVARPPGGPALPPSSQPTSRVGCSSPFSGCGGSLGTERSPRACGHTADSSRDGLASCVVLRSGRSLGLRWGSRPGGHPQRVWLVLHLTSSGSEAPAPGGPGLTHLCVFRWLCDSASTHPACFLP